MGIRVTCKTKAKASLKLYNQIGTYLFEEEYDELRNYATKDDIKSIKSAQEALSRIIERGKSNE